MLPFILDKKDCVGCTACVSACPVKCITMERDEEGFLYPKANGSCISCGKCEWVCPQINGNLFNREEYQQTAFAALSKDAEIWQRSASGGAFSEICKAWDRNDDTMFVGAAWNGLNVEHKCVIGTKNLPILCKSKYVASSMGDVFSVIKIYLENNGRVVFCGTPCQVAGLRSFLRAEYPNLLLIDLICHGVGSPAVFESCIENLEEQFGKKITSYEFRAKKKTYQTDYMQRIGCMWSDDLYILNDPYIQLFLSQTCLRASCGKNCKYRNEIRQGDITIADFKGLQNVFPQLNGTKRNYSSVIINSSKAEMLLPRMKENMIMLECSIEDIKKYNPLFYRNTWDSEVRDVFFKEYIASPKETICKYTKPASLYKETIKRKIYNFLPEKARRTIVNFLKSKNGKK